jgi:quercetin dioxygenase-like cupin family protein
MEDIQAMIETSRNIVSLDKLEQKPLSDGMGHVNGRFWEVFTAATVESEALRLLVQEYPPGGFTENHPVHMDFEQTYYVLRGTMTLFLDGSKYAVPAGTFVFIPRGARHEHRNDAADPLLFMTINVPVRSGLPPVLPRLPS